MFHRILFAAALVLAAPVHAQAEERYVLTISGGISLGAYDAGRNWVIMRHLHALRENPNEVLGAISGASAGAINAFISAMDWCTAEGVSNSVSSNPYRSLWTGITFDKLLPAAPRGLGVDHKKYIDSDGLNPHRDGLLARANADAEIMQLLRRWYSGSGMTFKPGCRVPLGIAVTRATPHLERLFDELDFTYPQQTYYIALVLEVGKDGRPHLYHDEAVYDSDRQSEFNAHNRNIEFDANQHRFDGLLLRLPSCMRESTEDPLCHIADSPNPQGEISFEQIIGVLYASSAVPLAFGRVFLDYCEGDPLEFHSDGCPTGMTKRRGDFVDGGVFDNVPIGLGLALANRKDAGSTLRFFYIDPDILHGNLERRSTPRVSPSTDYRLPSQLAFLGGTVETARAAGRIRPITDLCRDTKNQCGGRAIVAKRSGPITGEMLGAFGAFIDPRFSRYDYALGVADGIYTVAEEKYGKPTFSQLKQEAKHLGIPENSQEWREVSWLMARNTGPTDDVAGDFFRIHTALHAADGAYAEFTKALGVQEFHAEGNDVLQRSLEGAPDWYMGIAARVTDRLRHLEFHDATEESGSLPMVMAMLDNSVKLNAPTRGWKWWTTVNERLWWAPPQVGWEMVRGSLEIAWRPTWTGRRMQLEVPVGFLHSVGGDSLSDVQFQMGLNARFPAVKDGMGRIGGGPRLFVDLDPRGRSERVYGGGALYFDYLSVVRFELSYRDSPWHDYWFVTVSAYDLPSVARLFFAD